MRTFFRAVLLALVLVALIVHVANAEPQAGGLFQNPLTGDSPNHAPENSTIVGSERGLSGESVDLSLSGRESVPADRIQGEDSSLQVVRIAGFERPLSIGPGLSALVLLGASLLPIAIAMFRHLRRHARHS